MIRRKAAARRTNRSTCPGESKPSRSTSSQMRRRYRPDCSAIMVGVRGALDDFSGFVFFLSCCVKKNCRVRRFIQNDLSCCKKKLFRQFVKQNRRKIYLHSFTYHFLQKHTYYFSIISASHFLAFKSH